MKTPRDDARGFTLIEMLISLSIFAVITAFVSANFRAGRQGDELRIGSTLVSSELRRAQTAATAGQTALFCRGGTRDLKTCPGGTAGECPGGTCSTEVPNGWGVRLSTISPNDKKMILYADTNANRAYDAGEEVRTDSISGGAFVSVKTLTPVSIGTLDIVFEPPAPIIYFNGSTATAIASIVLQHTTTAATRTVTVNRISGQINAD
jgi:prepilin-type N-terminal cleavage/methylation domain-containing protein